MLQCAHSRVTNVREIAKKLFARKTGHIMTLWSASAHFYFSSSSHPIHIIHPNISNLTMRWEINGNGGKRARAMTKMCVELMSISWGEIITAICIGAGKDGWTLYVGVRGTKIDEIWFEFAINWIEGRLDDFLGYTFDWVWHTMPIGGVWGCFWGSVDERRVNLRLLMID